MALRRNVALQLSHSYKQITVLLITYAELTNRRLGRVKPAPRVTNFDIRVSQSLVNRVVTPKCCRQLIGLYLPESLFPNPPNPPELRGHQDGNFEQGGCWGWAPTDWAELRHRKQGRELMAWSTSQCTGQS